MMNPIVLERDHYVTFMKNSLYLLPDEVNKAHPLFFKDLPKNFFEQNKKRVPYYAMKLPPRSKLSSPA